MPLTEQTKELARDYIESGIFDKRAILDAQHVAIAVITGQDIILSWNFKHMVNRRKRGEINSYNIQHNLPSVEIIPPPEL